MNGAIRWPLVLQTPIISSSPADWKVMIEHVTRSRDAFGRPRRSPTKPPVGDSTANLVCLHPGSFVAG